MNVKEILKGEFTGYNLFDKLFMGSMVLAQLIVYYFNPDSILGMIAGISGVISVVLCAKAKISFYFIGFVQTITYLILSWNNRFYGEVLENIFYLVTMVWGIFVWKKAYQKDEDGSTQVETKRFTVKEWILSLIVTGVATLGMGYLLTLIGSAQAYTDACTNILAIIAQILMVKCYREQWIYWIIIDLLCIKLWFVAGDPAMVAMYIAWTINCVYGWVNWSKTSKK